MDTEQGLYTRLPYYVRVLYLKYYLFPPIVLILCGGIRSVSLINYTNSPETIALSSHDVLLSCNAHEKTKMHRHERRPNSP